MIQRIILIRAIKTILAKVMGNCLLLLIGLNKPAESSFYDAHRGWAATQIVGLNADRPETNI